MQKPLSIHETTWKNQPTIDVDSVRNIPWSSEPEPEQPVPVPGSLRGYISDYPAVLICSMSDGTKRLITTAGGAPSGSLVGEAEAVNCLITPSPAPYGSTVEQPSEMLFDFANYVQEISNYPFAPILAELRFTAYNFDPQYGDATWAAALFAEGVQLTNDTWVIQGDSGASAGVF